MNMNILNIPGVPAGRLFLLLLLLLLLPFSKQEKGSEEEEGSSEEEEELLPNMGEFCSLSACVIISCII